MPDPDLVASSDFDSNAEGWKTQVGYPVPAATGDPSWIRPPPGFTTHAIVWSSSMLPEHGDPVFFRAPSSYLGDLSSSYGFSFDFEIALELGLGSHPDTFYSGPQGLILESAAGDLWIPAPVRDAYDDPSVGPSQRASVLLRETPQCRLSTTGSTPTTAEFKAVLAGVTGVLVRITWYPGTTPAKSAIGAVALYGDASAGLDPKLEALRTRIEGAVSDDALTLDATVLGDSGAGIAALVQSELGVASLSMSGHVATGEEGESLTLSADLLSIPVLGTPGAGVEAVFGVAPEGLTILLTLECAAGWELNHTFPRLGSSWAGTIDFVTASDGDTKFLLASDDRENPTVAQGLNIEAKASVAEGAAKAVATLVTGAPDPLPLLGSARAVGTTEQFDLVGPLPNFSISLPVLPTLNFDSPYVRALGEFGGDGLEPIYVGSIVAGAQVSVGETALPLEVQTPNQMGGWQLGLAAGHAVGVGDVAAFLGDFTGLSLAGAFPSAVTALNTLQLRTLSIQLNEELNDYQVLSLGMGASPGTENDSKWTIIPGSGSTPLLALEDVGFDVQVRKRTSGSLTAGAVFGTFALSDTLTLQARVPVPIGSAPLTISAQSQAALPNLQDFTRFLGGQELAQLLPSKLGTLTSFTLHDLTFVYDPSSHQLRSVSVALAATEQWTIIEGQLSIENVLLQGTINSPLDSGAAIVGRVSGTIAIGPSTNVSVQVSRSATADPWMLDVFTEQVVLPSLGDLAGLMGGDVVALLPETIRDNHFALSDLELSVDVSNGSPRVFTFVLSTSDDWPIITDVLTVAEAGVYLKLDWSTGSRVATGRIFGNVSFCGAGFWLQADKGADSWGLSVMLLPGEELTLEHLADAFTANLWSKISALGVPNLALREASATYDTGSGDYTLSCGVGPASQDEWTVPIGFTSISIKNLGAAVTCKRAADGTASDKKVYVTGAFSVGDSLHFDVKYLAGDNLTIDCTLVGSTPVKASTLVKKLCAPGADGVTWTSAFESLDSIEISDVSAQLVLGHEPAFQLVGKITIDGTDVDSLLIIKRISNQWEFALAIQITQDFTLGAFDPVLDAFNIDRATWMVAASSFDARDFTFPASFATPHIARIDRGLDFYGTFSIHDTYETISTVTALLPSGTISGTELTVHGLLTDPLAKSYLEVILVSSSEGVPLMGWETVRLGEFSLRLTAEPAFALHGDFIFKKIHNPDGSYLHVILDLAISTTEVGIIFEQQPGQGAIFTWQDAFGIDSLDVSLTDLALRIIIEGPGFDGTVGGGVEFEHSTDPPNTVMPNALPHPNVVALMEAKRVERAVRAPEVWGHDIAIDYTRPYDPDGIAVFMKVSFVILGEEPVPVPYELAGHFHNFTLPYILHRFANVDIPDVLMPIQFPDVDFDFKLPNPLHPGEMQDLRFTFCGDIVIFGIAGHIDAEFDETRIKFIANMDPIVFEVDGTTILAITKSEDDQTHGPDIAVDSKPAPNQPNIGGDFFCDFFDFVEFGGSVDLRVNPTHPEQSQFHFTFDGHVGQLANLWLNLAYEEARYMKVAGGFHLALTTDNLPGFSHDGVEVASKIDLSKYQGPEGAGLVLDAELGIELDDRTPTDPKFSMHVSGGASLNLGPTCHPSIQLGFDIPVNKDSMSTLPAQVASQMATNTASIFSGLLSAAECFVDLVQIGFFVLEEAAKVSGVLVTVFSTGIVAGAAFLGSLGHTAADVAHSLWHIFDSHDNKKNTHAMKGAGYSSEQTAEAVKHVSDNAGHPYTPSALVHDQASAGYQAPQVAGALAAAFTQYQSDPTGAGQLLANSTLTSFNATEVAGALRSQYAPSTTTATSMVTILGQIYTGSNTLTAQEMANALAPLYPATEVAQVLRNHYAPATETAVAMAGLLTPAYQSAGHPLAVGGLGAALAPLYAADQVAPVLHTDFGPETDTAIKLGHVLSTAYTHAQAPLDVSAMAAALATVFTKAGDVVDALKQLYPSDTGTAMKMAGVLLGAYPSLEVAGMAAALHGGGYSTTEIAQALDHYYPNQAGTPAQMATVLAAEGYTPSAVSPVLKTVFPSAADTAPKMAAALDDGFGHGTIDAAEMAGALASAPFTPVESAPALHSLYGSDTTSATAMATLLITAYADGQGANTISADDMAKALAAVPYEATGDDGTAKALIAKYPTDTAKALGLSKLLVQAPYTVATTAPALVANYPGEVGTAPALAAVLASTPFSAVASAPVLHTLYPDGTATAETMYSVLNGAYTDPALDAADMARALGAVPYEAAEVSPVLKTHYSSATTTVIDMYGLLNGAYTDPVLSAADMAGALAAAPYSASDVAPLLYTEYPTDADTAAKLASLVHGAYASPPIELGTLLSAVAGAHFGAYALAPATEPLYTPTPSADAMAAGLDAALETTAPLGELQLGTALIASRYTSTESGAGVKHAFPDTSAGLMAAILLLSGDSTTSAALAAASDARSAGKDAKTAAPDVVSAVSGLTADVLATALVAVYSPPNLTAADLAEATAAGYSAPDAVKLAEGTLTAFPSTTPEALMPIVEEAIPGIGVDEAAIAVASAFRFVGSAVTQADFVAMVVQATGASANPDTIAAALVSEYASEATAATIIPALAAGFHGSSVVVDARVAAVATQEALTLAPTDADQVVPPLSSTFDLTRVPNDVGSLALACQVADFSLNATSAALQAHFADKWTPAAYQIVASVFSQPEWSTAATERADGKAIAEAAPAIYAVGQCDSALMVQVLAAAYDLTETAAAIDPMAGGLAAVKDGSTKVYTIEEASAAMSAQYSPDWTPADYREFAQAYGSD